jgi:hypothetical protein
LTEEEKKELIALVSEELRYADSLKIVIRCIALFKTNWEEIDVDARLRAENKLIQLIPFARKDYHGQTNAEGIYISWFISLTEVSLLKPLIAEKVYECLESREDDKQRFVLDYFGNKLEKIEEYLVFVSFESIFKQELKNGNRLIYDWISAYYPISNKDSKYRNEVENFIEARTSDDDLPF